MPVSHVAAGERIGEANPGYFGIPVRPRAAYRVSYYAGSCTGPQEVAQFSDAIKAAYPSIKLISTSADINSRRPDLFEPHFYETPDWFVSHATYFDSYSHATYFDSYSHDAPKVLVGEYAARTIGDRIGQGHATLERDLVSRAFRRRHLQCRGVAHPPSG